MDDESDRLLDSNQNNPEVKMNDVEKESETTQELINDVRDIKVDEQPTLFELDESQISYSVFDESQDGEQSSRKKRRRNANHRSSVVWQIFELDPKESVAICQLCGVRLMFWSSTTSLLKHFMAKHPEEYAPLDENFAAKFARKREAPKRKVGRPKGALNKRTAVKRSVSDDDYVATDEEQISSLTELGTPPNIKKESTHSGAIANVVERVTPLIGTFDIADDSFDSVLVVATGLDKLTGALKKLQAPLRDYATVDGAIDKEVVIVKTDVIPGHRLVFSPTGPVNRDFDDVCSFRDAAIKGLRRLVLAGGQRPLLICPPDPSFQTAAYVATLGALQGIYLPLANNETYRDGRKCIETMGLWCENEPTPERTLIHISAIECARIIARDMAVSDDEHMTPGYAVNWLQKMFSNTSIKVSVHCEQNRLATDFPLFHTLWKSSVGGVVLAKYQPRVIFLEYTADGPIDQTLFLIGMGVTKVNRDTRWDSRVGMTPRGRSGAGAVAGIFQILHMTKPLGLKVVGALMMLRKEDRLSQNSADVITARSGVKVRGCQTIVDDPLVLADMLCRFRESALNESNPQIISIGTQSTAWVTRDAPEYTIAVDNGPAGKNLCAQRLQAAGATMGDTVHIRCLHRQDFTRCEGTPHNRHGTEDGEEVLCANPPSRDLTSDVAFMIRASRLSEHGTNSQHPIPYTHLNLDQSAGYDPRDATGSPIPALTKLFIVDRLPA